MPDRPSERVLDYGVAIARLRQERGLTREALAQAAEISPSYLSEVERSLKRPSTDVLARLAGAFGMPPSQLLEYVEMLSSGPHVIASRAGPPPMPQQTRRVSAAFAAQPLGATGETKSSLLQKLVAALQGLRDDDLRLLLDLARHLARKSNK